MQFLRNIQPFLRNYNFVLHFYKKNLWGPYSLCEKMKQYFCTTHIRIMYDESFAKYSTHFLRYYNLFLLCDEAVLSYKIYRNYMWWKFYAIFSNWKRIEKYISRFDDFVRVIFYAFVTTCLDQNICYLFSKFT